jgi:hypothetical protein
MPMVANDLALNGKGDLLARRLNCLKGRLFACPPRSA